MSMKLIERETRSPGVTVVRLDFLSAKKEKNRWPVSFILAAALHCLVLFAGHYFIVQPASYGLEGSSASMEIYMIAAMPDTTPAPAVPAPEAAAVMPETESEMMVPKAPEEIEKKAEPEETEQEPEKREPRKAEIKGDGSSPDDPGMSSTTFSSLASSQIDGKEGKYRNPPPHYPAIAERNGWEGTVLLKAHIKEEGEAAEVVLVKSSGHRVLDESALKAVRKWKFTSAFIGNKAVSSWLQIPVRFTLDD